MNLPKEKILFNSKFKLELEYILQYADKALKEWRPIWTPFFSAQIIKEVKSKFKDLTDITCDYAGGFPNAERKRICFKRPEKNNISDHLDIPIKGIFLKGNFLFDRAKPTDFRKAMLDLDVKPEDIGDIWLIRDRGAQAICTQECADLIDTRIGKLREVEIKLQSLKISEMEIPFTRAKRTINTVEASTRIDAIASAGFGLSRSKITTQIKQGSLRLNWLQNNQPNKAVRTGDLIHLENKGSIKILSIDKTKKERWRIKLLRQ